MSLTLVREYLNLVDEAQQSKGHLLPCDLYRHMMAQGMESKKAAVMSGIVSVMGGMATNPGMPFVIKTQGVDREVVQIPRHLDTAEVLKQGGKGLVNQVMAIAEALLIPELSAGLTRKLHAPTAAPEQTRGSKKERGQKEPKQKKIKQKKGLFQVFDLVMQNKAFVTNMLAPLLKNMLKA